VRTLLLLLPLVCLPAGHAGVVRLDADGVVHPVLVEMLSGTINKAQRERADLVLIRLNTPGGLMEASREAVQLVTTSPVPVAVWVGPGGSRAASAGFFLLLSADVAAMAPGTRTGAASPVLMGGEMDPVMRKKVESDASAWIRSIATQRGRDAALAEKTVLEAKSFTEREALEAGLIDLIAASEEDLLKQLDGRTVKRADGRETVLRLADKTVYRYEPSLRQRIVSAVADPNIAFILLLLGGLGLYLEFTTPGAILPGVLGALLLLFGLSGLSVLPISGLGVALLLLAVALFIAEAFVSSHGVLGVGGAVALVFGALLLVDGPPGVRISLGTALGAAIPFAIIAVFLGALVARAHKQPAMTGDTGLLGATAVARTPLQPGGTVFVHGEYWDASSSVPVGEGARVRVTGIDGLRLRVEPLP
jgi:membrane-bound serine protease (ClpP class)